MAAEDRPKNENAIRVLGCGKFINSLLRADSYIARSDYSQKIIEYLQI